MYTRSRSSTGGPGAGFGAGRGQMNSGNGNFQGQNSYNNHPGGNYQQPNYNPGMIQQSAPFKPSGGMTQLQQQQAMKSRQQNQQSPNPNQNQQRANQMQNQQNSNPSQQTLAPSPPKLKPILKQSTSAIGTGAVGANQSSSTPTPVPPPAGATAAPINVTSASTVNAPVVAPVNNPSKPNPKPVDAGAAAGATTTVKTNPVSGSVADEPGLDKTTGDPQNAENVKTGDGLETDDPNRWMEDDQTKWTDTDEQNSQWMDTEDGQQQIPKWRRFKKLSTNKPNKKLKRLRMNQRLRKTLMPKNAIMVLNEMKAGVQFTFPETQAIMPNSLFLVHAELEGKVYVGQGLSKPLARQNAAENALKCLLLEKMTAAAMKERVEAVADNTMDTSESQPVEGQEPSSKEGDSAGEETATDKGDDIPWSSLASFALYKLFLEWQNQGTVVPIPRPGVPPLAKNRADPKPSTEKVLPPNALDIHPVMLLNQMRPGTMYNEVGRVGNPPNILFTLGVEINGQSYTGSAKNKKDAKKMAAKSALKDLYNLEYPEEMKTDVTEVPAQ